jgi:cytochrome c oxidase subunit 2
MVATALLAAGPALADNLGQPTDGAIGMQPAASPLKHAANYFHDAILFPITTAIAVFVLLLLIYVAVKFNKRTNPEPARFTHNTPVEILWTTVPVLILMFIAIFSFRLLYAYHDMPKADLTVKVTGNQWYWNYEYPDQGAFAYDSILLPEDKARAQGVPFRLAVDKPMVVPVGKVVKLLITGADVIHAVGLPAFGLKTDAIPGRVNETWFKAERPGVYYGQCSELCGVDHAFMPIEIDVVDNAGFAAFVANHAKKPVSAAAATASAGSVGNPPGPNADQGGPGGAGGARPADATAGPTQGAPPSPAPAGKPPAAQTSPRGTTPQPGGANGGTPASAASPATNATTGPVKPGKAVTH